MNELTIGLLGALLATNPPGAVSNIIQQQTGVAVAVAADPAESDLRQVMLGDEAALDDVQKWIREFDALPPSNQTRTAGAELNARINARFDVVRKNYAQHLQKYPGSAKAYLAYGSFLTDIGDEEGSRVQYLNSKQIDPKNPAVWNQLANYYGHNGELTNAFAHYAEAIRLNPAEPVYYQNFATTVYLYRKDAREFFHLNEQQVFDKALGLYRQAMKIAPDSFVLATDYAESFYGIKPWRTNDAFAAWSNALQIAHNELERQGVRVHLARWNISIGEYSEASNHLAFVTEPGYQELSRRLYRSLLDHKNPPPEDAATNAPGPAKSAETNQPAAASAAKPAVAEQKQP